MSDYCSLFGGHKSNPCPCGYPNRTADLLAAERDAALSQVAAAKAEAKLWRDAHGQQTAERFDQMVSERDAAIKALKDVRSLVDNRSLNEPLCLRDRVTLGDAREAHEDIDEILDVINSALNP